MLAVDPRLACYLQLKQLLLHHCLLEVIYGPWWDHYLYFWKRRHDENILLLRFEDMKRVSINLRVGRQKVSFIFLKMNFSHFLCQPK